MLPHWDSVVRPFLAATGSGPFIEIGAYSGETTAVAAELATERETTLHVIDPDPRFDVAAFEARFGKSFRLHRGKSHELLREIEPAAAVLIDGDHNWYTVHRELELLAEIAESSGSRFPLTILHDVEWPYARRDMYWDPESIPDRWRRPWARDGIRWDRGRLDPVGGISRGNAQAIEEGGPANGVLTAVEDFIEESEQSFELRIVNGDHGIGVLVSAARLADEPAVRDVWESLVSTDFLSRQARELAGLAAMENAALKEALDRIGRLEQRLEEATAEATTGGRSSPTDRVARCNICGGSEFVPGPNGRLTPSGEAPQCENCRSLERQRALRESLSRAPRTMLSWRRAIQFAPDASLDPAWFLSLETSSYGGENSIDLQEIDRPSASYDFISLSSVLEFVPDDRKAFDELMRVGSDACVLQCTFLSSLTAPRSSHFEEPRGDFGRLHDYGRDLTEWFEVDAHGLHTLVASGVDPATGVVVPLHFFCRKRQDAEDLLRALGGGDPAFHTEVAFAERLVPR